jgi:ATP-dependent Clp protease ATP-binding subunit ClpX
MLEASEVVVPLDLTHSSYADHVVMSTADIAFIAAGAFSGFQQIAHRRAMRDSIGFGRDQASSTSDPEAIAVDFTADQVENVANFQAYGFLPELVARFTRVVPFKALDAGTLKDILKTDVVARMTREFKLEGFELTIEEAVLDHIVTDALKRETGARGLASTLTRHLEDVAFDSFGVDQGGGVRVRMRAGDLAVELD